jgi:hypothetical protein
MDSEKSWHEVEKILEVMEHGFEFLNTDEVKRKGNTNSEEYEDTDLLDDEVKFARD